MEHVGKTHLLTPEETRERLGVTRGTLAVWRCTQRYNLPFVRIGSKVMYREEDVEMFIAEGRVIMADGKPTQNSGTNVPPKPQQTRSGKR